MNVTWRMLSLGPFRMNQRKQIMMFGSIESLLQKAKVPPSCSLKQSFSKRNFLLQASMLLEIGHRLSLCKTFTGHICLVRRLRVKSPFGSASWQTCRLRFRQIGDVQECSMSSICYLSLTQQMAEAINTGLSRLTPSEVLAIPHQALDILGIER